MVSRLTPIEWLEGLGSASDLGLGRRARAIFRDTKQYALREWTIRGYLRRHAVRKLHLGAGENLLPGWLNTDREPISRAVAYLDVTRPFPLDDGTFHYVFSEHHIEHITYSEGARMLSECHRVLTKGGKIRIATPDLARLLRLYKSVHEHTPVERRYIEWIASRFLPGAPPSPVLIINNNMRFSGHQFLYDANTLASALSAAGFVDVQQVEPEASADPHLDGIDAHGRFIQAPDINRFETMVLEGTRT